MRLDENKGLLQYQKNYYSIIFVPDHTIQFTYLSIYQLSVHCKFWMESDQYIETFELGGLKLWKISCYEECDIPKAKKRSTMDDFSKSNETTFVPKIPKYYSSTFVPKPSKYFTKSENVSLIKKQETVNKRIQTEIDKKFEILQNPQTKKLKTTIQNSKSEETFETKSLIKKDVMTQEEKLEIITAAESFGSEKLNWDVIVELCPICRSNNRKKSTMKSFYSRHLNK